MRRTRFIVGRRLGPWWLGVSRGMMGCGCLAALSGLLPLLLVVWVVALAWTYWYISMVLLLLVGLWLRREWRSAGARHFDKR